MGTNYYIRENECKKCKRKEEIHLGKSSYGWEFTFQYNNGKYYKNIEEMKEWLKEKQIYDEYDEKISQEDFWKMVEVKKGGSNHAKLHPGETEHVIDGYSFSDGEFC